MKRTFIITKESELRSMTYVTAIVNQLVQEDASTIAVDVYEVEQTRTIEQNSKLQAMLHDISKQVDWIVDGEPCKLSLEDWKIILTAGLKKNQRVAKGIEGGFVILGSSTSKMKVKEMIDLIEFAQWFGSEHNVTWSGLGEL